MPLAEITVLKADEPSKSVIKIGSKDFTENLIVVELYALALEDKGYKVERLSNISAPSFTNP